MLTPQYPFPSMICATSDSPLSYLRFNFKGESLRSLQVSVGGKGRLGSVVNAGRNQCIKPHTV